MRGTWSPLLEDLTILNSFLTIRFHGSKPLIFSMNLLLDVFMASCSIYKFPSVLRHQTVCTYVFHRWVGSLDLVADISLYTAGRPVLVRHRDDFCSSSF